MVHVKVTVAMGRKTLAVDEVKNASVKSTLAQAGRDLGTRLSNVKCPVHGKAPLNVQLHFDASGAGDVKYESCCEKLGEAVGKIL